MFKPDVIVTWPSNCDYPLWRQFVRHNRYRFNKVYISFMEANDPDNEYRNFVIDAMRDDKCSFFFTGSGPQWRNNSVNHALRHVGSDTVWFTEQDFTTKGNFWGHYNTIKDTKVAAIFQGERMHPACIFAKVETIEKTSKNFDIGDGFDHFGRFQKDVEDVLKIAPVKIPKRYYEHMNGLSHNFHLVSKKQTPVYKPIEFYGYLRKCLEVKDVPLNSRFITAASDALPYSQDSGVSEKSSLGEDRGVSTR